MSDSIPDSFEQPFSCSGSKQKVEVVYGPMFSGKTEELIRRLRKTEHAGEQIQAFKPEADTRHGKNGKIVSHGGETYDAHRVTDADDIFSYLSPSSSVVGIDEVQFFDSRIISVIRTIVSHDCRVILAGLDRNFRGETFGHTLDFVALADKHQKFYASCAICGSKADRTQRLVDGEPAHSDNPTVVIGGNEIYEPRCRKHHIVK
jgi:thymidine kinase